MDDDDRFSAALHHAVRTLEPPTRHLVDGAITRGRRRTRIVRGAEALTGGAVLAGVAALTFTLVSGGGPSGSAVDAGNAPTARPAPGRPTAAVSYLATTPQTLLATTLPLLPAKGTTSHYAGNSAPGFVGATFVFDDGHGAAAVAVSLTYRIPGPKSNVVVPCSVGSDGCAVLRSDGAHAQVFKNKQYSDGRTPNATEWTVDLVRRDGVQVSVVEYNAPAAKGVAPTRTTPPFTIEQLTEMADSPAFQIRSTATAVRAAAHLFEPRSDVAPAR